MSKYAFLHSLLGIALTVISCVAICQPPRGPFVISPQVNQDKSVTDAVTRAKAFENDLMHNIIPCVEKNYRAISNKDSRAIGGFSRGGGQTLRAGFGNMDEYQDLFGGDCPIAF